MKKMLKNIIIVSLIAFFVINVQSCSTEKLNLEQDIIGLGGDKYPQTPIDNWLYENYVADYNMEVKYRFNQFELDLNQTLVPIKEENVVPVMEIIKDVWIHPYEKLAGETFIKTLAPKKFVLVGSPKYSNGTIILGEAEGGRKIVIFRLNWFKLNISSDAEKTEKKELIQSMMKTVHHEFVHTMHQTVLYPEEFMNITPGGYTASWHNVKDEEALSLGYISAYACSNSNEDFAETISRIVVYGKEAFDKRVAAAEALYKDPVKGKELKYNPAEALRKKEAMCETYLKEVWNVNLYDSADGLKGLETLVQEAIAASIK